MEKYEDSWYNEDDTSQDEEDLDLIEEPIKLKKKTDFKLVQCPKCEKMLSTKLSLATHLKSVRPCTMANQQCRRRRLLTSLLSALNVKKFLLRLKT